MPRLLRRLWAWLKNQVRWIWGASKIGLQGVEYDEETGKLRRKP
jgi:hypothetical protein